MAELAYPGTDKYAMAEFMAVIMARDLAGDEEKWGGGGANVVIPLAAGRLAQLTVAPNIWLFTGGAGVFNGKFDTLPLGTWDPRVGVGAECKNYMMDVVDLGTSTRNRLPFAGLCFCGMQVDRYGNINMIGVGGSHPTLKVRGPGTVGGIWMGAGPNHIFVEHHSRRIFVDRVEYISGAGWLNGGDSRYEALDGREGPTIVWTPICVCDFTEDEHRMRLVSVHPGYTVDDVVENTGFELVMSEEVPTTTPPTDWELEMLRTRVDRGGQLRTRRLTVG